MVVPLSLAELPMPDPTYWTVFRVPLIVSPPRSKYRPHMIAAAAEGFGSLL
jgi:hypothetical protein